MGTSRSIGHGRATGRGHASDHDHDEPHGLRLLLTAEGSNRGLVSCHGHASGRASDHGRDEPHGEKLLLTAEDSNSGLVASSSVSNTMPLSEVWLNDSIYQLHKPTETPNMQVLFFHGLQFGDGTDAHLSTWTTGEGSEAHIWPQTWLVQKFPRAHVLCVSYDARVRKADGNPDLYIIGENLTSDLVAAGVGQNPRCPVILVGHCFGGLVIKQLCSEAHQKVSSANLNYPELDNFLRNVKAIFFYGTPHHGIPLKNIAGYFVSGGPLLPFVKILSKFASRLNFSFDGLLKGRYKNAWLIGGLGESRKTKWGEFNAMVVPEASARYGDCFNVVAADHITISKPETTKSRSFLALIELIGAAIRLDLRGNLPVHKLEGTPDCGVDLQRRAGEIELKLEDKQVVGIAGMGGIGKTTLAKVVFNNISWQFEYTCFVDNVKGREKHELKGWLLSNFYRNGSRVDRLEWSHLQDKTTLIVMDDVGSNQLLSDVLPHLQDFGSNTRVIITTRDQSVLKQYDDKKYICHEVEFLAKDDAHKLFCKHAFDQEEIPRSFTGEEFDELESDVRALIKKCDGLPLTLEVMGRYLRAKQKRGIWKEAIKRLGEAQDISGGKNDRVWASLSLSYDDLEIAEQEMFVSAATCFFGKPLNRALAAWSTSCEYSETGWENLMSRCLVKEVTNNYREPWELEYKTVWVHEHLRDLAHKIAPGKMMDVSYIKAANTLLTAEQVEAASETEYLRIWLKTKQMRRPFDSLVKLKKLKYMELKGVLLEGSVKNLPKKLSLLRWERESEYANVGQFPVNYIENMDNLAVLQLANWQISAALPVALGNLTNLHILILRRMELEGMDSLDGNNWQDRLELMHLIDSSLPVTWDCWDRLQKLKSMRLEQSNVSNLSESFGRLLSLENLVFDEISLTELPQSFGNLRSLVNLELRRMDLTELPQAFGNLRSLVNLQFNDVKLTKLPQSFGNLGSLVTLVIWGTTLMGLPQSFGNLGSLVTLEFSHMKLMGLPQSFGNLRSLVNLKFRYVEELKELPESFGNLGSLVTLEFSHMKLMGLPQSFGNLHSLVNLKFSAEEGLKELPESFGNLGSLVTFEFYGMKLMGLPQSFGNLRSLVTLTLVAEMERLPDTFGQLTALRELRISACNTLRWLPSTFGGLTSLQTLDIDAGALEALHEDLWQLTSLQKLTVVVNRVKTLPESVGDLSRLQRLTFVSFCVETLPDSLRKLTSLQELELSVKRVRLLPESVGQLTSLRKLSFYSGNAESLPDSLGKLTSLQELELSVERVRLLPESVGQLTSLRKLSFYSENAESLPDSLRQLASLQHFTLRAPKMKVLPERVGHLPALQYLTLQECTQLVSLPNRLLTSPSSSQEGRRIKLLINRCPLLDALVLSSSGWDIYRHVQ